MNGTAVSEGKSTRTATEAPGVLGILLIGFASMADVQDFDAVGVNPQE
jgi:hypothetical protein